jgi:hypothetical protein
MISDECHSNIWWTSGQFSLSPLEKGKTALQVVFARGL